MSLQNKDIQSALNVLQAPYLAFTTTYVRSKIERLDDLERLMCHPMVKELAFAEAAVTACVDKRSPIEIETRTWLLIATHNVEISDGEHRVYDVGEFLVYISRHNDSELKPTVWIENISPVNGRGGGPRAITNEGGTYYRSHPHINGKIGMFCMSNEDRSEIVSNLVCGDILGAFTIIDKALHSLGPDAAFLEIYHWNSRPRSWRRPNESD